MNVLPYIAQNGVHHKVFGGKGSHNAMWDFAISPQGRIYLSLCSELIESSYARLYEYLPGQDAFDLLFRGLEVTTGGQRIHDYAEQVAKLERKGMNPEDFAGYLMIHKYGTCPHGGLGLGLERLTSRLVGENNVREACLFPRDQQRIEP